MSVSPLRHGVDALTDREKHTLRLLLAGHDAKSIAQKLDLSVHTVNERLRDARRKLDVSSSREAARMLAEAEQIGPKSVMDKRLGVAPATLSGLEMVQVSATRAPANRLVWFGGGMLIMSLIIAAAVLASALGGDDGASFDPKTAPSSSAKVASKEAASFGDARQWVRLIDRERWQEGWQSASGLFRSQVSASQFAEGTRAVREPLGPVLSRTFQSVTKATALPGLPTGTYEVIEFRTVFTGKKDAVETVAMARDGARWRVIGYFIR